MLDSCRFDLKYVNIFWENMTREFILLARLKKNKDLQHNPVQVYLEGSPTECSEIYYQVSPTKFSGASFYAHIPTGLCERFLLRLVFIPQHVKTKAM